MFHFAFVLVSLTLAILRHASSLPSNRRQEFTISVVAQFVMGRDIRNAALFKTILTARNFVPTSRVALQIHMINGLHVPVPADRYDAPGASHRYRRTAAEFLYLRVVP